jgi:hypothetical protein
MTMVATDGHRLSYVQFANPEHWRSQRFFGFVSCRYRDVKPEKFVKGRASRLKAGCTVESLALPVHPVCDAAASSRIKETAGELYLGEVFIPFHGPKAHADSQD